MTATDAKGGKFTWNANVLTVAILAVLAILVICSVFISVGFIFYAALIATPIWLFTLMMMGLDGSDPAHAMPDPEEFEEH